MEDIKQITLRIPQELYEALEREAEDKHITKAEIINIILYDYYSSNGIRECTQSHDL